MNIEVNLKKFKTTIKKKRKITLALMLSFLMTGTIGFAETPTVEELQQKIQELQSKIEQIEGKINKDTIKIGNNSQVNYAGGTGTNPKGGIAIGENANVHNYIDQSGGIAIGQNAYAESMIGQQEKYFAFNKNIEYNHWGFGSVPQNDFDKLISTLVIGENTYARSGGIMIGPHNFRGKMGDIDNISTDTDKEKRKLGLGVLSTTLGTNSFTNGAFATTLGAYSIITSQYNGDNYKYVSQNFGALINGSLNSIESFKSDSAYSGIANSVVGVANRTYNSNGSLIFGAGNEITNSIENVNLSLKKFESPNDLSKELRKKVSDNKGGGATLVIGGGNKADYTKQVSMIGTRNEVKGTEDKKTELVSVSGDNNLVENSRNIVAGKNFHVKGEGNVLQGFNNVDDKKRREITNSNVVALGNDIEINTDNSVYLGTNSTEAKEANTLWRSEKDKRDKAYGEYAGFDHIGGIVTVGNDTLTRVIQNVAPGLISATSTDAINGSQLYNYVAKQYITIKDGKGGETKVKLGDTLTLKGTTIDVTVKAPEPAQPTPVTPTETKAPEHTATFEAKGNVGGSDTFGYKYRDDKGKETELKEGPDGKLYTNDFIENNEYKNNKWVKKGTDTDSENINKNQYNKSDEKVILSTKYGKIITDVAEGVKENDAVNVKQLKEVENKIKNINIDSINEAKEKSNLALSGVANAIAIANLVQVNSYSDYRHNLSAAYGYYGKQHALAIGFSGVTENRRVGYKISGSVNTKGNLGLGVGVGVMLGEKSERKLYPEKSNLVKDLKEKVNMQNKQIEELKKENQEIKEMLKKIMEK
ncbi:YadA-like family protein [uncultured Sneathia sp.]|uniref:YadA-like family protein n=1 Tax=uncultured Sneathia sp. TaxID=278067 RepID=UPI002805F041|nr:YadA-like family protein [uncultured Sneathia sp.]